MENSELFYLRDSRSDCGSSAMFWAEKGGYTTDLSRAEKFTREKAIAQHNCRETDIPVRCDLADAFSYNAVDMQLLPDEGLANLNYLIYRGQYDGNNVRFYSGGFELHDQLQIQRGLAETIIEQDSRIKSCPANAVERVARPVVRASDIASGLVLRKAKIKMNERLRRKRTKSDRVRFNCPKCGKINWSMNPYDEGYCAGCCE